MTRDEAVLLLMKRLGNRTDTSLRNDIINEMDFAQDTILEGGPFFPWFLQTDISSLATSAGDEKVALPSDFLHEMEDSALYRYDSTATGTSSPWIELVRDDWDVIKNSYTTAAGGVPKYYDISGAYFLLADTPDAIYALRLRYIARDTDISGTYGDANNIENNWLKWAPDWLIAETGIIISSQYLQSQTMVGTFAAQAQRAKKRLYDLNISMQESNKKRSMGDD